MSTKTTVEIRRYANKKYYHPVKTAYVTMEEIGDEVAGGARVRVVCDRTGRDITLVTLARVLYDELRSVDSVGSSDSVVASLGRLIEKVRSSDPLGTVRVS